MGRLSDQFLVDAGSPSSSAPVPLSQQLLDDAARAPAPKVHAPTSWLDAPNAFAAGVNSGALRLLGLPVDTAANVLDLGKAALGTSYRTLTGKSVPNALTVNPDRSGVVGSGDWFINQASKTDTGKAIVEPMNPDYQDGYLYTMGSNVPGALAGGSQSRLQLANQLMLGVGSGAAGKFAYDQTGDPAWATTASLLVPGAEMAAAGATKRAVRGGDAGRQAMADRIWELNNAGVSAPTLGLASGNKTVGGAENILASTPGAMSVLGDARTKTLNGLRDATMEAASLASPNRGSWEAGSAIQRGIKGSFMDGYRNTQANLYDQLDQYLDPQTRIPVGNTQVALDRLTATVPGAEQTSKQFVNGRIAGIKSGFDADTGQVPVGSPKTYVTNAPPQPVMGTDAMGMPKQIASVPSRTISQTVMPRGQTSWASALGVPAMSDPTLPYQAVKQLRTNVGQELGNSILSGASDAQWKALYGGLSGDMKAAADSAGPQAQQAWNRANSYTRAGSERMEKLAPFTNTATPEQAYTMLMNTTRENNSALQAVKKSLPADARGTVAGTVIERLGRATPSAQNEMGDAWSFDRFLTNWNTMTPKARDEIFSGFPNAPQVKAQVESVAKAASMMRDNSKLWANPSGTAANITARLALGSVPALAAGTALGSFSPAVPLGAAAGLSGTRLLAHLLTDKDVVNSFAKPTEFSPRTGTGLMSNIPLMVQLLKDGAQQEQR